MHILTYASVQMHVLWTISKEITHFTCCGCITDKYQLSPEKRKLALTMNKSSNYLFQVIRKQLSKTWSSCSVFCSALQSSGCSERLCDPSPVLLVSLLCKPRMAQQGYSSDSVSQCWRAGACSQIPDSLQSISFVIMLVYWKNRIHKPPFNREGEKEWSFTKGKTWG